MSSHSKLSQTVGVSGPPVSALAAGCVVLSGLGCQFQFLPVTIALMPRNSVAELCSSDGCQTFPVVQAWGNELTMPHLREALPSCENWIPVSGGTAGCCPSCECKVTGTWHWWESPTLGAERHLAGGSPPFGCCPVLHVPVLMRDSCSVSHGLLLAPWHYCRRPACGRL